MPVSRDDEHVRLGFLTAVEVPERGYVGGLLVTNRFGRPLEFQCTSPVKPNRTQEILYGPTLVPFVLGELIGRTLLEKVGVKPHLVLTEQPEMLEVRQHVSLPVACIDANDSEAEPLDEPDDAEVSMSRRVDPAGPPQSLESAAGRSPAQLLACSDDQESGVGSQESEEPSSPLKGEDACGGEIVPAMSGEVCSSKAESTGNDSASNRASESNITTEANASTDTQDPRARDVSEQTALAEPTSLVPTSECAAIAEPADLSQETPASAATAELASSADAAMNSLPVAPEPLVTETSAASPATETIAPTSETAPPAAEPVVPHKPAERRRRASSARTEQTTVALGRQILRFHDAHPTDCAVARQTTIALPRNVDLREPFQRVREALAETMRAGATR